MGQPTTNRHRYGDTNRDSCAARSGWHRAASAAVTAVALASLLAGCGLFQRESTEPPAPLPDVARTDAPSVLWERNIGTGGSRFMWAAYPAIEGDRVWVVDARGQLTALSKASGAPLTDLRVTDERVTAGVGIGDGRAVIGTAEGVVHAIDTDRGAEVWQRSLGAGIVSISDVVAGRVVARASDGRVLALSTTTGETLWAALRSTPALSLQGAHRPQLLLGQVLVGFDNGRLVMFGLERGTPIWDVALAVPSGRSDVERLVDVDGRMAIGGGAVFVSSFQGRLAALSIETGSVAWSREFSSHRGVALDPQSGRLFAVQADDHLHGFDARDGRELWEQRGLRLRGLTSPVVHDGHLIVGDFEGYLHWIDQDDGSFVARVRIGSRPILGELTLDDGVLYAMTADGRVVAVRASLGVADRAS